MNVFFLAVMQVAVFLVLAGIIFALNAWENRAREVSLHLSSRLETFSDSPAEVATELYAARLLESHMEEFLANTLPAAFCAEKLIFILDAVPYGATLSRVDYIAQNLTLTAITHDIYTVEIHRAGMAEIFPYVQAGRISRLESGLFSYEIFAYLGDCEC
ncbi:MAG: hypothetical protein FWF79_01700 [Defluviitaleaceae bacterium]|nr:hypothetical protein [Defluviitaleaceae bacterium]